MIYLALPYSHDDPKVREQRYEDASEAYAILTCMDEVVLCPILMSHPVAVGFKLPADWETWKDIDLEYLDYCDDILVLSLDGWEESVGVTAELEAATELGIQVTFASLEDLREFYREETGEEWAK